MSRSSTSLLATAAPHLSGLMLTTPPAHADHTCAVHVHHPGPTGTGTIVSGSTEDRCRRP
jgi:hypothetical protein